jgi:hypothetical protein
MSAQAARERKKARMDELERQLTMVSERLRKSELENYYLRERLTQYESNEFPVDQLVNNQSFRPELDSSGSWNNCKLTSYYSNHYFGMNQPEALPVTEKLNIEKFSPLSFYSE